MSLLPNGHKALSSEIETHADELWAKQRSYVLENSPFYQELWHGIEVPETLKDLAKLPLSDKSQLRLSQAAHPPFGDYLATHRKDVNRLHRTSGTTGQAMNLALSKQDSLITQVVGGRCQSSAGLGEEHTVVHCLNYQMWMGGLTDHMTLEETGALVIPFGVGSTELLVRTIQEVGVSAISCTPSYPAVLEQVLTSKFQGLKPKDLGLKIGLFGGEPGVDDPAFRARMKEVWGMEARNANYGVSDVFCNFAAECPFDTSLHFLAADVLHPELIDPDTAAPLEMTSGAKGELVLTHLARECQPLVRFRTGDIIEIQGTDPCECGCTGFRFRVVGRSDDMIVVRGLNMFPTMVAAVINEFEELSGEYRIVLDNPPPYDVLPIETELNEESGAQDILRQRIADAIKSKLGASAEVKLLPPNALPRTEGKTKRVVRTYE
ncbi:phenylacetate--CoA ligase family protein [Sneathiella sp. P13V-1]|uniref:phenylacetate--CoA ligase family protein n=1 Tax=Sneathiella sp. P13V-1 TaxID=2697366 RepID=UPI00187B7D57|nr:phenylacetate--CoA ligase family protein [Sneathiella sp. P13V-1]MBE7638678.1 phenylacetate--CoA ligase family protein [Sneathiella sp. P13V-1]